MKENKQKGVMNGKKFFVSILSAIVILLVFALGYILGRSGFNVAWEQGEFSYSFKGLLYPEEKDINFDLFWDVWSRLETEYVDKAIDEEDMFYGAIKGMVSALGDPATQFFTAEETDQYDLEKSGMFSGIGIEMGYLDNQIIIQKVFEDTPASESGLEEGDVILKVDGEDMSEYGISEYANRIRGEEGTDVALTVLREDESVDISITRGEVYVESMNWEMLDNDIAFITIRRFTESDYSSFVTLWDKIASEVDNSNTQGIIVDLRANGGGYLDGAVYIGGEFLDNGDVILYVQDREGRKEAKKVSREGKLKEVPLVILVDAGTASSSEIFSGALQYYDRAIVIGEETYGKGTAQDVLKPVTWGGASIHITAQKWLLPNKRWINSDDPIMPDIEVGITIEEIKQGEDPQLDRAIEEINKAVTAE